MKLEERFWKKVDKTETCWNWTASLSPGGYGRINVDTIPRQAHRVAYELVTGLIPTGLDLDHLCRNRACVNPAHLEAVTRAENLRRGIGVDVTRARHAAKTHCPGGHEYTPENTYTGTNGRACRECQRRHQVSYRERKTQVGIGGA